MITNVLTETCGVENLLPITDRTNFITPSTSNRFATLITNYTLSCCGNVRAWGAYTTLNADRRIRLNIDFQVWRQQNASECAYSLVGNNTFVSPAVNRSVFFVNVPPDERIGFQMDDIIGIQVYPLDDNVGSNDHIMHRNTSDLYGFTRRFTRSSVSQSAPQRTSRVLCEGSISLLQQVPVFTAMVGEWVIYSSTK